MARLALKAWKESASFPTQIRCVRDPHQEGIQAGGVYGNRDQLIYIVPETHPVKSRTAAVKTKWQKFQEGPWAGRFRKWGIRALATTFVLGFTIFIFQLSRVIKPQKPQLDLSSLSSTVDPNYMREGSDQSVISTLGHSQGASFVDQGRFYSFGSFLGLGQNQATEFLSNGKGGSKMTAGETHYLTSTNWTWTSVLPLPGVDQEIKGYSNRRASGGELVLDISYQPAIS